MIGPVWSFSKEEVFRQTRFMQLTILLVPFGYLESKLSSSKDVKICLIPSTYCSQFRAWKTRNWTEKKTIQREPDKVDYCRTKSEI